MLAKIKLDTTSAIYQRRAVRSYTAEKIEKETIEQLLDAAVHAPTAVHREPWAFVVIQNKERLRQYSDRTKSLLLSQQEATSFFRAAEPKALAMLSDPNFNIFYDAGTLVVIGCKARGPFVEADCWLAAENLMLAATAAGLGTCCIGFAVNILNTPEVKRELGIPEAGAAVAPLIIGVPKGPVPASTRRSPEVLSWTS
ncbi:nitroreductase family protein [Bradyrhizobium sp. GCM10027634]|uniref:nitroreductase family protein n=1 Tax=unclassified Bradyrhizobium TaxID=2631580 RepID=UPI00263B4B21|nr:nitroreductase family protein [Bradyrhizobium sp. WYCCWR 12677]MDN5001253.1 nitroreductase family protein [Bradyrhizobium sp. WYCCWR 12677]